MQLSMATISMGSPETKVLSSYPSTPKTADFMDDDSLFSPSSLGPFLQYLIVSGAGEDTSSHGVSWAGSTSLQHFFVLPGCSGRVFKKP